MSNSYLSSMTTINEKFGDDFSNLPNKFIAYREVILKRKQDALEKIKSQVDDEDSNIFKILNKVYKERQTVILLRKEVEQLKLKYVRFKKETQNIRNVFQNLIEDLKLKSNRMMYFACLRAITFKSNNVRSDLANKFDYEAVMSYKILCELGSAMNMTPCKHLISYLYKVITYWHCILKLYYSEDFEIALKQINWPFTMTESSDVIKLNNLKLNFQRLANILIKVQLPKSDYIDSNDQSSTSQLMDHFTNINLPITLLIVPFQKRFFFHFTGKKQTNQPDKPEWFLSRILSWIRDYQTFVLDWLGPVYEENDKRPIDSQYEFTIGLLQSVVLKLDSDLSHFQLEDVVFSHIVDETLAFEHELRKVYGYPSDYPSVTEVLTQAHIFFKWINMERKYANIKIDAILHDKEHFKTIVNNSQYCMTACADSFLTLLNTINDRYIILRQPRHKLQFLKLQIDLLEEFKQNIVNCVVGSDQSNEYLLYMICTLHYISYILNNWGTNMHFLSLLHNKCELDNEIRSRSDSEQMEVPETAETVFDDSTRSYTLEIEHLLGILCDNIMSEVKQNAKQYKSDKWHIMNSITDENKYSITDSGWVMYETFCKMLRTLNKNLPIVLFDKCWPTLADKLSTFIYADILLANIFNKGGAQHLLCDIQYKMIPIFSKYTNKPTMYIERLLEACKILCLEPNFKPVALTQNEISEVLLHRIEHNNQLN